MVYIDPDWSVVMDDIRLPFEEIHIIDEPPPPLQSDKLCCCLYSFSATDGYRASSRKYCGFRELHFFPFWSGILAMVAHIPYCQLAVVPGLPDSFQIYSRAIFCLLWFYVVLHFFLVYFVDPGILPWNWSVSRKKSYNLDEIHAGMARTLSQVEWAETHSRPARSHFSRRAGYFILRGDHDCYWVSGWIGIRNHRYFVKSVISGAIYGLYSFVMTVIAYFYSGIRCHYAIWLAFSAATVFLTYIVITQTVQQSHNLMRNLLTVEILSTRPGVTLATYRKSCIRNWEEVCGDSKYMLCWACPCPVPMVEDGFGYGEVLA
jgi:hypothetical protein